MIEKYPMKHLPRSHLAFTALIVFSIACADGSPPTNEPATTPPAPSEPAKAQASPADIWWNHLSDLCGKAFSGTLTSEDPTDAALAEQSMTMHVRRCEERRLEIPFHVGENRSRTWILTRTDRSIRLQHDHRHEDGSEDTVSLYGGHTETQGTEVTQQFPADDFSKQLFEANGLSPSVANVWSMEIIPGERFSYILRRPGRHFQADFDLSRTIDTPPPPWGLEQR